MADTVSGLAVKFDQFHRTAIILRNLLDNICRAKRGYSGHEALLEITGPPDDSKLCGFLQIRAYGLKCRRHVFTSFEIYRVEILPINVE